MIFVLLDCQPLNIGGNQLGEILGPGQHEMLPSENDACIRGHRRLTSYSVTRFAIVLDSI